MPWRARLPSDQNGRYRLTDLFEGSSSVTTTVDGYDTDTRTVAISGEMLLDIRITPRVPHTLSGQVYEMTASGRVPLEGVRVLVHNDSEYFTDANGFFICTDVLMVSQASRRAKTDTVFAGDLRNCR